MPTGVAGASLSLNQGTWTKWVERMREVVPPQRWYKTVPPQPILLQGLANSFSHYQVSIRYPSELELS